jgi:hypothetical protein
MTAVARGCTPLFWMLCKGARVMLASASRLVLILHPHPQHISEFPSMAFPFTLDARAPLLQFTFKSAHDEPLVLQA